MKTTPNFKGGCILAGAGCGKTMQLHKFLSPNLSHLLITFSKAAVQVAESRGITAVTLHALCYRTVKHLYKLASTTDINFATGKTWGLDSYPEILDKRQVVTKILNTATVNSDGELILNCTDEENDKISQYIEILTVGKVITFDMLPLIIMRDNLLTELVTRNDLTQVTALALDEAQDTSITFLELIVKLLSQLPKLRNFWVVGDFRQSIYSVNGSTPGSFAAWLERNKWLEITTLDTNYRSHSEITDFLNHLPLPSVPTILKGDLKSAKGAGGGVRVVNTTNEFHQLIHQALTKPASYTWLAPTNSQCSNLQRILATFGVPSVYEPARSYIISLSEKSRSALFTASLPNLAITELLFNPEFAYKIKTTATWQRALCQVAFLKHIVVGNDNEDFFADITKCRLARVGDNPFARTALRKFFGKSDNLFDWFANCTAYLQLQTLEQIKQRYLDKGIDPHKSFYQYLCFWAYGTNNPPEKDETTEVTTSVISTMHGFKGMESDCVIVLTPDTNTNHPDLGFYENDRLFYVACSRPRDTLFLLDKRVLEFF